MVTLLLTLSLTAAPQPRPDAAAGRARAAFALTAAVPKVAECGRCRTDAAGCRSEAKLTGKPLVFVVNGDCGGVAVKTPRCIFCRVPAYTADATDPPDAPRFVVVVRGEDGLVVRATLPLRSTASDVLAAAGLPQLPPPPAPKAALDWGGCPTCR